MQFHAGSAELLDGLDRTLRITDGVMRFRLIKLAPGVPEAPEMGAATPTARHGASRRRSQPSRTRLALRAAAETPPTADAPAADAPAADAPDGTVAELA